MSQTNEFIFPDLPPKHFNEVEEQNLESLSGSLPELLRVHFSPDSPEFQIFKEQVLDRHTIPFKTLKKVPEEKAKQIISLVVKFFEVKFEKRREIVSFSIAELILSS